ncbi:MAG: hypothetical protein RQ866_07680 [Bacteroidales bacterium]|nr:hypothetical protein [Bacteroidales bacterium]
MPVRTLGSDRNAVVWNVNMECTLSLHCHPSGRPLGRRPTDAYCAGSSAGLGWPWVVIWCPWNKI